MSSLSMQCGPRTLHRQHAATPLTGVKAASPRPRCVRVRSMAQPVYETANIVQAALPVVLKMLPGAVTAGVALYAGANWLSYSRLRREMETRQRQASAGAKTRQDKLERLGLGHAAKKEGQPAASEEGEGGVE